ncbi:MAG: 50S ribosomal protein L17 [Vulcanimicrobiota bacterium]
MRHKVRSRRLGRQTDHRIAMLRNLTKSLLTHQRITTTDIRAKELQRYVEHLITWARKANAATDPAEKLAAKRQVFREIAGAPRVHAQGRPARPDRDAAQSLFDQIATRYAKGGDAAREGGYTRIVKLYPRKGDGAPMALIELIS